MATLPASHSLGFEGDHCVAGSVWSHERSPSELSVGSAGDFSTPASPPSGKVATASSMDAPGSAPRPAAHTYFNVLLAGASGLGKTQFVKDLALLHGVYDANSTAPGLQRLPSVAPRGSSCSGAEPPKGLTRIATLERNPTRLQTKLAPLELPGRLLHVSLQDTPGYDEEPSKVHHLTKIVEHIVQQRERDYRTSFRVGALAPGGERALPYSVSLCLYFLPPTPVSSLDLVYMAALSAEVPLLPVLSLGAAGAHLSAEEVAELRRGVVAAMQGFSLNGKPMPIVPLELDDEAVDALLPEGAPSAVALRVLVVRGEEPEPAAGAGGPDAALLRRLMEQAVEPVMRSAEERFHDFCERYEAYGHDVMGLLAERMEPFHSAVKLAAAAAAAAAAASRRSKSGALAPRTPEPHAAHADHHASATATSRAAPAPAGTPFSTVSANNDALAAAAAAAAVAKSEEIVTQLSNASSLPSPSPLPQEPSDDDSAPWADGTHLHCSASRALDAVLEEAEGEHAAASPHAAPAPASTPTCAAAAAAAAAADAAAARARPRPTRAGAVMQYLATWVAPATAPPPPGSAAAGSGAPRAEGRASVGTVSTGLGVAALAAGAAALLVLRSRSSGSSA
ncbi:hypothetical protein HYH03_009352 [Edaphochlamys debaryana]|uniref:Septin-type G domain-containing protein n=1 Tax=Edaphochlamys debaryana TaxID=47281 RepID=A0A835XY98_9CHLO|nr:hypothetical protein HYH03_009352 [Edaphochlamys debaryana]|eukprot:KAG2492406.1 hypothetical protein HYH03_009352 [Edaphochlamys debaryana]